MSDTSEFSFSSDTSNAALGDFTAATPDQTPAPAAQDSQPAAAPDATAQAVAEQLYEVKVGGRPLKVSLEEALKGYMRNADYTQKTQGFSTERQQYQAALQQAVEKVQQYEQFINDPRVRQHLQQLVQQQQQQAQPTDSVSAADVRAALARQAQAMEQRIAQQAADLEIRQMAAGYETQLTSAISQLMEKFPTLKQIDDIDFLLRRDVQRAQPESIDEAMRLMAQFAERRHSKVMEHFQTQQKQHAVQAAQLARGIERPGGTAVTAQSGQSDGFKVGDTRLTAAVIQDLMGASRP